MPNYSAHTKYWARKWSPTLATTCIPSAFVAETLFSVGPGCSFRDVLPPSSPHGLKSVATASLRTKTRSQR